MMNIYLSLTKYEPIFMKYTIVKSNKDAKFILILFLKLPR